ncbi:MAG: hypothetical protein GY741_02225 [Phycisphaeraceae bacterium]|nr:hypothetical protein [Phycisphaeraceae bacterium]
MSDLLESLRQSFADPITRHAMLVHFPIAISILAVPFVLALCGIPGRRAIVYRLVLTAVLFGTAVVAWQAGEAGEAAEPIVEARLRTDMAREILSDHASRGEIVPILLALNAGLVAMTLVPRRGLRLGLGIAATLLVFANAGIIGVTAHEGGLLVHRHGGSTPGAMAP